MLKVSEFHYLIFFPHEKSMEKNNTSADIRVKVVQILKKNVKRKNSPD